MKSIVVIIPYFGKFLAYFNMWLLSVKYNPTVDFCIITKETYVTEQISVCELTAPLEQWTEAIEGYAAERVINKSNGLLEQFDIKEVVTWISNFYLEHEE